MPYNANTFIRAPMKPSPSALSNNLCLLGKELAFAHRGQIIMAGVSSLVDKTPVLPRRVGDSTKHGDAVIYSITACAHHEVAYIVVCTEVGVQVWDKAGGSLVFVWKQPTPATPDPITQTFTRGASINISADGAAQVCVGTSTGQLHVISLDDVGRFKHSAVLEGHKAPVSALSSAYQSRRGVWSDDLGCRLVSGDDEGVVIIWEAASASAYSVATTITSHATPVVSLAVRNEFVVVARLDGLLAVHNMKDGRLHATIQAHSRMMSGMAIHPTKDVIATSAQDGSIGVWTLPIGGNKWTSLMSTVWMLALPTGIMFCGPTNDDVAVVAYEADEVRLWKS